MNIQTSFGASVKTGTVFLHADYADLQTVKVLVRQNDILTADLSEFECVGKNSPYYANGPYICLHDTANFVVVQSLTVNKFKLSEVYVWKEVEAYRLVT